MEWSVIGRRTATSNGNPLGGSDSMDVERKETADVLSNCYCSLNSARGPGGMANRASCRLRARSPPAIRKQICCSLAHNQALRLGRYLVGSEEFALTETDRCSASRRPCLSDCAPANRTARPPRTDPP